MGELDYYLELAEEANSHLNGPEQAVWLQRIEAEHDGFQAAISTCLDCADGADAALRLCGALQQFWWTRGHIDEGRRWSESALEISVTSAGSANRARVLNGCGVFARMQGDYAAARAYHEQSLSIRREIDDRKGIAASLNGLGNLACAESDHTAARLRFEESLSIKREFEDRRGIAGSLNNLGYVAYKQGDYPSAQAFHLESLSIQREFGNQQGIAASLEGLAEVSAAERDWECAVRLWGAADVRRETAGVSLPANEQAAHDELITVARTALGEEAFAWLLLEGRAISTESATAMASS